MFVFGINLPVAEILFVLLILFVLGMVFIILQLVKMSRHIRVLDETTLEIRRYEEAEEITLRAMETNVAALKPSDRKRHATFQTAAQKLALRAVKRLLDGEEPFAVKNDFMARGLPEALATRAVNDASYWLDRFTAMSEASSRGILRGMRAAARK